MRRLVPLALLLALSLPALAQAPANPAAPPKPAVEAQPAPATLPAATTQPIGLKLFPDSPRGHFGEPLPGNTFAETQQKHLLLVEFDKAAAGQKFDVEVRAVNTAASGPAVIFKGEATVSKDGLVPLQVRLPRNWPVGQYDVRITKGGQPVALLPYRVLPIEPRVTPITVEEIGIEKVVAPGKTEPATVVKPGDRHLNFATTAKGSNTGGVKLLWVLTALRTSAGSAEVSRLEIPGRLIDDTELQFDVALPADWPTGTYRVELQIDGRVAGAREFKIER